MEKEKNQTNSSKELSCKTTPGEKIEISLENELVEIISWALINNSLI